MKDSTRRERAAEALDTFKVKKPCTYHARHARGNPVVCKWNNTF
jgi:hypothetical protein